MCDREFIDEYASILSAGTEYINRSSKRIRLDNPYPDSEYGLTTAFEKLAKVIQHPKEKNQLRLKKYFEQLNYYLNENREEFLKEANDFYKFVLYQNTDNPIVLNILAVFIKALDRSGFERDPFLLDNLKNLLSLSEIDNTIRIIKCLYPNSTEYFQKFLLYIMETLIFNDVSVNKELFLVLWKKVLKAVNEPFTVHVSNDQFPLIENIIFMLFYIVYPFFDENREQLKMLNKVIILFYNHMDTQASQIFLEKLNAAYDSRLETLSLSSENPNETLQNRTALHQLKLFLVDNVPVYMLIPDSYIPVPKEVQILIQGLRRLRNPHEVAAGAAAVPAISGAAAEHERVLALQHIDPAVVEESLGIFKPLPQ